MLKGVKNINENITLIFYTTQKYGYIYYILGSSDFIYKITINKNFMKHKTLCKYLCFVLFKVLKVYKIFLNNFSNLIILLFDTCLLLIYKSISPPSIVLPYAFLISKSYLYSSNILINSSLYLFK